MSMQYKSWPVEFKATGDKGEYEGHFAVFGNVDDGGDITHPGAFLKTIQERGSRVKVFYAHDFQKLIGPPPEVLKEDTLGLYAKGRLTLDSFWGKEAWALMKDGALTEGSFGYDAVKWDYEERIGEGGARSVVRNLRELKLYEISPVPLGMNPLTDLSAIKALFASPEATPELQLEACERAAQALGQSIKAGRVLSASNLSKAKAALGALQEAIDSLQAIIAAAEPEPEKLHSALRLRARAQAAALALTYL